MIKYKTREVLTLLSTKNLAEIEGLVVAWPWQADHGTKWSASGYYEEYVLEYSEAPGPKSKDDQVTSQLSTHIFIYFPVF